MACMSHKTTVRIHDYQKAFLDEHGIKLTPIVRDALDDRIIADGLDPDELEERHGR